MIRWKVNGNAIAQRTKVTLGITGLSPQEFTSTGRFGTSMSAHRILEREVRSKGLGCSPIKAVRELGSERRETVRSLSVAGGGYLRRAVLSTRGPGWTYRWCNSCHTNGIAVKPSMEGINAESI